MAVHTTWTRLSDTTRSVMNCKFHTCDFASSLLSLVLSECLGRPYNPKLSPKLVLDISSPRAARWAAATCTEFPRPRPRVLGRRRVSVAQFRIVPPSIQSLPHPAVNSFSTADPPIVTRELSSWPQTTSQPVGLFPPIVALTPGFRVRSAGGEERPEVGIRTADHPLRRGADEQWNRCGYLNHCQAPYPIFQMLTCK